MNLDPNQYQAILTSGELIVHSLFVLLLPFLIHTIFGDVEVSFGAHVLIFIILAVVCAVPLAYVVGTIGSIYTPDLLIESVQNDTVVFMPRALAIWLLTGIIIYATSYRAGREIRNLWELLESADDDSDGESMNDVPSRTSAGVTPQPSNLCGNDYTYGVNQLHVELSNAPDDVVQDRLDRLHENGKITQYEKRTIEYELERRRNDR